MTLDEAILAYRLAVAARVAADEKYVAARDAVNAAARERDEASIQQDRAEDAANEARLVLDRVILGKEVQP